MKKMSYFVKATEGCIVQYFEPNKDGMFVCIKQEFIAGDVCSYEDYGGESVDPPNYHYHSYDMVQPGAAKEMLAAIEAGKYKVKTVEAGIATTPHSPFAELRKNSAWLDAVYDIINRTALAIKDELENIGG